MTTVSRGIETDSSRNPGRPAIGFTREDDHENPRQTADLGGYAPVLARHYREPVNPDIRKSFIRLRFRQFRDIDGPVDTREARAYPRQSRSIGS